MRKCTVGPRHGPSNAMLHRRQAVQVTGCDTPHAGVRALLGRNPLGLSGWGAMSAAGLQRGHQLWEELEP